jgi:phthiocerol/phenolphthiocerol synthesis type-I polyketide synthase C
MLLLGSAHTGRPPPSHPPQQYSGSPVAIIGLAFRFPGDLEDGADFWSALQQKRDLVTRVPEERWSVNELQHDKRSEPGRSVTFAAGVLSRIDAFDAGFFGISPREAAWLDPQQRLLLELSWEAMENAGLPPSSLAGTDCAVYVGIASLDYGTRGLDDLAAMSPHSMTGNTLSMAANRLSYVFDLHGPSLAVDTACSSSLTALHHACRALQNGEAKTALVGGVNLLLHPYPFVGFTKASMISADGRCKVFDAAGNGYVRAEGGAVLLLKPLDRALADGDDIQAVILGTGVNADGGRKSGLTIPSREAQAELMRQVLQQTGLSPLDIDFIEAHGTGTMVGDPIECAAIGEVYGRGRSQPLPIGSVKANIGHLEAASGMAGLVKTILALKHRALPPQIHLQTRNPNIDFVGLNLEPVTEYRALEKDAPLIAGVNSFGFGGANAHVLLMEYRTEHAGQAPVAPVETLPPLFLSAHNDAALRALAERYAVLLPEKAPQEIYDIAHCAAYRRERLARRLAVVGQTAQALGASLSAYAQGESPQAIVVEEALPEPGGIAFVYSGNGAQWLGMGRHLLAESPRFAELLADLDARMQPRAGFSLLAELQADAATSRLDDTAVAQPLLFALQVAVTQLLKEQGIEPAAVNGHSVGEVAAAWAAGALDLDQAIRVIVARSRAQGLTRGMGRMAAVGLSADATLEVLADFDGEITLAGINSPHNVTLSGKLSALEALRATLEPNGVFFRLLDLDYAFHSPAMDGIEERLRRDLNDLSPVAKGGATFVSTVTGGVLEGTALDGGYWWRNVREPVAFEQATRTLLGLGCRVFVEIGPHAVLQRYLQETVKSAGIKARVLPTLRREADGWHPLQETALRIHLLAQKPNLSPYFPHPARRVRLPNYPWQRERHWHPRTSESLHAIERRRVHPLLGWRIPEADHVWENVLDPLVLPWLADHKVGGAIVFPGAAYAEMALAAAREWLGGETLAFEEMDIVAPMVFDGEHARTLRFELNPRDGGFLIKSRQRLSDEAWTLHAAGRILQASAAPSVGSIDPPPPDADAIDGETHYRLAASLGLDYGPAFQGLQAATVRGGVLQGVLRQPLDLATEGYLIHPGLLDVCYQSLVGLLRADIEAGRGAALLPVKTGRLDYCRSGVIHSFRARVERRSARSVVATFELYDAQGVLLARLLGCRFRAAPLAHKKQRAASRWRILPSLRPHPAEGLVTHVPAPQALIEPLRAALAGQMESRSRWFKEALPLLEALVLSFAFEAYQTLAAQGCLADLTASSDPHTRWLNSLLREEGLLIEQEGEWRLADAAQLPPAEEIWRTLLREHAEALPHLVLVGRVGRHLPHLLLHPEERTAFLRGLMQTASAEALYQDDPAYAGIRHTLEHLLRQFAAELPPGHRLRVLELAGGASELARSLLTVLPQDRLDYVLVLPQDLAERQHAEYAQYANLTVVALDDKGQWELAEDGPQTFDLVILRHALHRMPAPRAALTQAWRRLAAGGLLAVAERHADWSADFIGGLQPDWWRTGSEAAAVLSSLMPPHLWQALLAAEGFEEVTEFSEPASEGLAEGAYLLLARRPLQEAPALAAPPEKSWLLLTDDAYAELAEALRLRLESQDQRVAIVGQGEGLSLSGVDHVVWMRGWGDTAENTSRSTAEMLALVKGLVSASADPPKLWIVTRGGALVSHSPASIEPNPAQAALWGFGRAVMNEAPMLGCTLIDLGTQQLSDGVAQRLERELLWPDGANELLLAVHGRYALVMKEEAEISAAPAQDGERFRLDFHLPGQLRNAVWLPMPDRGLAPDEVEVEVKAAGLNFRDVMYLMGLLPDEAVEKGFAGASLGLEFAGIVRRVGTQVRKLQPGEPVMGFGSACFASHVITRADAVAPMPQGWSFASAATVPTVFFTVHYALKHLANLQAGERVLIHGAAGGVGIAAIQLAKHLGAEVFATAGSDEKRDVVWLLGADHVFDSRSLRFADDTLAATGGEGVDVVLNSLAGEAMRRSLAVLKPFGRFLELGKRDFFENTPIGLRPFKDNISYFGIDADQLLTGRPKVAARLFREVMALFREGALTPLPYRLFSAERVVEAFRTMQQARHIGKVVVSLADAKPMLERPVAPSQPLRLERESTWLVTGGLAGFGLASARWLAGQGVGCLVLVGRRGIDTPGAQEAVAELTAQRVQVLAEACDITDIDAVRQLIERIRRTCPPLKGVLHAAAVFDDALLTQLDGERMQAVIEPKLRGAWNLHQATLDVPLEYFVLYSSVTTALGNPGQANYVAANAGLEGLAEMRRRLGLPAVCIGWGPIGDVGILTRNEAVKDALTQRLGRPPLPAAQALDELKRLLVRDESCTVADFDWKTLARLLPSAASHRFLWLNRQHGHAVGSEDTSDIRALLAGKTPEEANAIVQALVMQEVAKILGIGADRIDPTRPLHDLGLDSLMAVELALSLEQRLGIKLPVMMLNESPTAEKVTRRIVERLLGDAEGEGSPIAVDDVVAGLAQQHGETATEEAIQQIAQDVIGLKQAGARLTRCPILPLASKPNSN